MRSRPARHGLSRISNPTRLRPALQNSVANLPRASSGQLPPAEPSARRLRFGSSPLAADPPTIPDSLAAEIQIPDPRPDDSGGKARLTFLLKLLRSTSIHPFGRLAQSVNSRGS